MCGQDEGAARTPEYEETLGGVVARWRTLADPWNAAGAERRDLRRALMAARMQGACWGDLAAVLGVEKEALKGLFGCMPRYGQRGGGEHGRRHGNGEGHGGCGGHGHEGIAVVPEERSLRVGDPAVRP